MRSPGRMVAAYCVWLVVAGCAPVAKDENYYASHWRRHRDVKSIEALENVALKKGMAAQEVLRLLGKPDQEFEGAGTICDGKCEREFEYDVKSRKGQPWWYTVHFREGKVTDYGAWTMRLGPILVTVPENIVKGLSLHLLTNGECEAGAAPYLELWVVNHTKEPLVICRRLRAPGFPWSFEIEGPKVEARATETPASPPLAKEDLVEIRGNGSTMLEFPGLQDAAGRHWELLQAGEYSIKLKYHMPQEAIPRELSASPPWTGTIVSRAVTVQVRPRDKGPSSPRRP